VTNLLLSSRESSEELKGLGPLKSFMSDAPATHTAGAVSTQKSEWCCKQHQITDLAADSLCKSHYNTWLIQQMNSIAQIRQTIQMIFTNYEEKETLLVEGPSNQALVDGS
jgi:hypothetical protein